MAPKTQFLLLATAATIGSAQAEIGSLDRPFTIAYRVVERDMRSRAVMDDDLGSTADSYRPLIKSGKMTVQQVEDLMRRERLERVLGTSHRYKITLSYDGKTLAMVTVSEEGAPDKPKKPGAVLLRKDRRFTRTHAGDAELRPGIVSSSLENVPYVGASLPFLPFVKDGKVLNLRVFGDKGLVYVKGAVLGQESKGIFLARQVDYQAMGEKPRKGLVRQIMLSDHTFLSGQWVAKKIEDTSFHHGKNEHLDGQPDLRREFTLIEASAKPLSANSFDPESYLDEGEPVQITRTGVPNRVVIFSKIRGGLDAQFDEDVVAENIAVTRSRRNASSAAPGAIAAFCIAAGLVWTSRRKR